MKVLELKGYKSLQALNIFHTLMLGLKMLPAYEREAYEDFFARIQSLPASDQEKLVREAAVFVKLEQDEVEAMVCFVADANGVPYGPANLKSMGPDEIHEMVVAVCMEIAKIKINLVTENEKKN